MTEAERTAGRDEGGCLCGHIRYSFAGEPLITAICHCRHCQRQSGSAFSIMCAVPAAAFEQKGVTKVFDDRGESGKGVARHFCPDCGSPIVSVAEAVPGLMIIKDIAPLVAFLASDAASFITGSEVIADGGYTAA